MRFEPVPVEAAEGKILGHNIHGVDGRYAFRKGICLTSEDVTVLQQIGRKIVYVAELDEGDSGEDLAAERVARAVMGAGLKYSGPSAGRVNFRARGLGLFRVDVERLGRLNDFEGTTLATLTTHSTVRRNQIVATVKVIPFALPEETIRGAEAIAQEAGPLIWAELLKPRRVGLILSASPGARQRVEEQFAPLQERVEALSSELAQVEYVDPGEEVAEAELAAALTRELDAGMEVIILAGETAVMDRRDVAPRAVEQAGGQIECVGAPVDPGNLLMLAYIGQVPVLGAPGCARSRNVNIVDWVLPRLLAGEHLRRSDIVGMGHGGLLEDLPERPMPRSRT